MKMKRSMYLLAATAFLATPTFAETPTSPPKAEAVAEQAAPIDPIRLSAAKPVIDRLWPLGTYRKMMDGTMSKLMDQIMGSMMDMPAKDMIGAADSSGKMEKAVGDSSMGEMAEKADPAFRERMKITMDVMMREMIPLMEKIEPEVRNSLANIYARRFSAEQLADMDRFFATPTGSAYASQSMLVMMDPEMLGAMQKFAPDMMRAMPDIMKKVEAATAHLPKPMAPTARKRR
jgi:hypothetical protein